MTYIAMIFNLCKNTNRYDIFLKIVEIRKCLSFIFSICQYFRAGVPWNEKQLWSYDIYVREQWKVLDKNFTVKNVFNIIMEDKVCCEVYNILINLLFIVYRKKQELNANENFYFKRFASYQSWYSLFTRFMYIWSTERPKPWNININNVLYLYFWRWKILLQ